MSKNLKFNLDYNNHLITTLPLSTALLPNPIYLPHFSLPSISHIFNRYEPEIPLFYIISVKSVIILLIPINIFLYMNWLKV